jgi:hypothetical protein
VYFHLFLIPMGEDPLLIRSAKNWISLPWKSPVNAVLAQLIENEIISE